LHAPRSNRVLFIEEPVRGARAGLTCTDRHGVTVVTPELPEDLAAEDSDIVLRSLVRRLLSDRGISEPDVPPGRIQVLVIFLTALATRLSVARVSTGQEFGSRARDAASVGASADKPRAVGPRGCEEELLAARYKSGDEAQRRRGSATLVPVDLASATARYWRGRPSEP